MTCGVDVCVDDPLGTEPRGNMSVIDLTWCEEEGRSKKKRKRMDRTADKEDREEEKRENWQMQDKLIRLVRGMDKEVRKIAKIVSDNPNTKRELKDSSAMMRSMMSQMTTNEMYNMMRGRAAAVERMAQVEDAECQTDVSWGAKRDMATQTLENRTGKVKKAQIAEVDNYDDYARVRNLEWPEEVYVATIHEEGMILQADREYDVVVWDEGDVTSIQTKKVLNRYTELRDIEGEVAYLYLTTKREDAQGNYTTNERVIMRMRIGEDESEYINKLKEVRRRMEEKGRIKYPPTEDDRGEKFRRMVECVFASSNIKCNVWYKENKNGKYEGA